MSSTEILKMFEAAYVSNPTASVDDAVLCLSAWIAKNRDDLSSQDFATMTAIGGVLFGQGLETQWGSDEAS